MRKNKAYTLEELEQMNKEFNQRIADAKAEIEQNKRDISAIESKMDTAANNGDVAQYKKLFAQRAEIELNNAAVSAILEKSIANHAAGFNDTDVCEAWGAWADKYNEQAIAKIDRFNALVSECRKLYKEIIADHDSAENMRDRFKAFTTLDCRPDKMAHRIPSDFRDLANVPESDYYFDD